MKNLGALVLAVFALVFVGCDSGSSKAPPEAHPNKGGAIIYAEAPNRDVRIVAIGDSHTNGHIDNAYQYGSTAEYVGTWALLGARDWQWAGTQWNGGNTGRPFQADSQVNSTTTPNTSYDPYVGLGTGVGSWLTWLPLTLRASYLSLNNIYVANFGVGSASTYTWNGENGRAYFVCPVLPNDGDTVGVCGQTYRFKTVPAVANDVLIGADGPTTLVNLASAINLEVAATYVAGALNPNCYAPTYYSGNPLTISAVLSGTAGNSFTLTSSAQASRCYAEDWVGNPGSPTSLGLGSATSALYQNTKAILAGGSGFGTPVDVITITLGSNDCSRHGYRNRSTPFGVEFTSLLGKIHSDFPSAKVIAWNPPANTGGAVYNTCVSTQITPTLTTLASTYSWFGWIDYNALGFGTGFTQTVSADGVHLSSYGYSLLAQMMAGKIGASMRLANP